MATMRFDLHQTGARSEEEAFAVAVREARLAAVPGVPSGTIADKARFVLVGVPHYSLSDARDLASEVLTWARQGGFPNPPPDDIGDPDGPAGFIQLDDGSFYFFGVVRR